MTFTPLAERIYRVLVQRLRSPDPLISYGDLVRSLGSLPTPDIDLAPNDQRLFAALGEIARACQSNEPPLPILTSIVVRRAVDGRLGTPGAGYFALVFPAIRDETAKLERWREEVESVLASHYPNELASQETSRPIGLRGETFPPTGPPLEARLPPVTRISRSWLREPSVIAAIIGLVGTLLTAVVTVWISTRHEDPAQQHELESAVPNAAPKSDESSHPRQPGPPEQTKARHKPTLDEILDVLERYQTRATFGAVAAFLNRDPLTLFSGYTRTPKTAWVVSKTTGLPTGTKADGYPPGLLNNKHVIDTSEELRTWLRDHESGHAKEGTQ
jgi:hypothetical protein